MKNSKEKEHRISNLKEMINNIKESEEIRLDDEIPEDDELINYLNEDSGEFTELEIDEEFIYRPGEEDSGAVDLEEEDKQIDEGFIIKTPKVKETENEEEDETEEFEEDIVGDISENFDSFINAQIGGKPILAIVSTVLGIILIAISLFIFTFRRADRVIDNVVAGETSFVFIIFLAIGALLIFFGLYKLLNIKNPIDNLINKADSIEDEDDDQPKTPKKKTEKPSPKVIPKSEIPLDKDAYKIGEFDMEEIRKALKKPTDSKKKAKIEENLDDIPPAKEKPPEKKGLTTEEIEEMEHDQVILDSESIDDIFAEVEDLEELPIISIDSEDKEEE
ncbi:topoisomerase IV [Methanobrevibacter sp.]|uniref:topoisomerase IV n=1 Tax=Methanobrevibacter sp. TaxID=66852 RepID=UPI0025D36DD3|nr:topoisomerase IV [Methanobrevibacter sp.]MBR4447662.1 topoisomerase IV [Methanobrevibacter sp.]